MGRHFRSISYPYRLDRRNSIGMIALLIILCIATSCISTEVVGIEPITAPAIDTSTKSKPHKPQRPPDPPKDTTERAPITFDPSVENWDNNDIEL